MYYKIMHSLELGLTVYIQLLYVILQSSKVWFPADQLLAANFSWAGEKKTSFSVGLLLLHPPEVRKRRKIASATPATVSLLFVV